MDLAPGQITDWLECFKSVFALLVPLLLVALSLSEVSLWGLARHSDSQQVSRFSSGRAVQSPIGIHEQSKSYKDKI